jgi:hypothetical protein
MNLNEIRNELSDLENYCSVYYPLNPEGHHWAIAKGVTRILNELDKYIEDSSQ